MRRVTPVGFTPQGRPGIPGPQGPQGLPGPQGPPGRDGFAAETGFGIVTFTERSITAADSFEAGVRKRLMFEPTQTTTANELNPPFVGHVFFANNVIVARALGDVLDITVNLLVTADLQGGRVRCDLDVGSTLGPVASDTATLFEGAGVTERVTLGFPARCRENFMANGGLLYLTTTIPLVVVSETLAIRPHSIPHGSAP